MITISQKGNFSKTYDYLMKMKDPVRKQLLDRYGQRGVQLLMQATPKDTGLTAGSWSYDIIQKKNSISIVFNNSNIQNGVPIAVILQYGHATNNGGWVEGVDYINPALTPLFEELVDEAWKEVTRL